MRAWADGLEISTGHRSTSLSLTIRASLASGSGMVDLAKFEFLQSELVHPLPTPFAIQTFPNRRFIVFANLSQISPSQSSHSPYCTSTAISPCRYLLRRLPERDSRHTRPLLALTTTLLGPTHARLPHPARGCGRASPSRFRRQAYARTSLCVRRRCRFRRAPCSLYHPLVRAADAKMKYIADYPSRCGIIDPPGSSGQGGTDISQDRRP